jgi:DDE superfamily endonuclease
VIDESGLLMAPLVRRTWAPQGKTPKLAQRGGTHEKVSAAAAVWLSPSRDRLGLFARTLVNGYFDNWSSAAFLEVLLKELPGRVVVIWDGGSMHKGDPIDQLQDLMADRLCLEKKGCGLRLMWPKSAWQPNLRRMPFHKARNMGPKKGRVRSLKIVLH